MLATLSGCRPHSRAPLRITFLDVGQGDASLIECPDGRVVLIDGGGNPGRPIGDARNPGARVVLPFLRRAGINRIDLMVATHADDDHVQGLAPVAARMQVSAALDGALPTKSGALPALRALWRQHRTPIVVARRGQCLALGDGAVMEILNPSASPLHGTHSDDNNNAIVARVIYGRARILLLADAEDEAERDMILSGVDLRADIVKAGHHGSGHSTGDALLDRAKPGAAIVSCGRHNRYGHPHPATLARLQARHCRVWRTDQNGAVCVVTDGQTIRIQAVR